MKNVFIFDAILLLVIFLNNSCTKTKTEVVTKKDTVILRDTIHLTAIREDVYKGLASLDCPGGCPPVTDPKAIVEVAYFLNDSTRFKLTTLSLNSSGKYTFTFSVVKGKFSAWEDEIYSFQQKGSDSLIFNGIEQPAHGLGTPMFWFQGKKM
jgi:hypothetical protein